MTDSIQHEEKNELEKSGMTDPKQVLVQTEGMEQPGPAEAAEEVSKAPDPASGPEPQALDSRRIILWGLGGSYLLYVGFQLCAGFIRGDAESSIWFFLAGILFFATGVALLIKVLRDYKADQMEKAKRAKEGRPTAQDTPFGGLFQPRADQTEPKPRKMSISERARLGGAGADSLEENQVEEKNQEENQEINQIP